MAFNDKTSEFYSRLKYQGYIIYRQIFTTVEKTFFSLFFRPIFLWQFFEQPFYPQKLTGVLSTLPFGGINAAPYGSRREN